MRAAAGGPETVHGSVGYSAGMAAEQAEEPTPEPRWLTEDEMQAWIPLVTMLVRLPAALDAQLQRDAGMSHFEYGVLANLSAEPARMMRMSDLAYLANGSLSRLSHVVKRLEQRGWVRRETCPDDSRYTNAILTDAGMAALEKAAPGHVTTVRELILDRLTAAQIRQMKGICTRIVGNLKPDESLPSSLRETAPVRRTQRHRP